MNAVQLRMMWVWAQDRLRGSRTEHHDANDRGELIVWVVMTATLVIAAVAIVGILVNKATTTANNVNTNPAPASAPVSVGG